MKEVFASVTLEPLGGDLFKSENGSLYFRSLLPIEMAQNDISVDEKSSFIEDSKKEGFVWWYRDYFEFSGSELRGELNSVIDEKTWERISSDYYVDKSNVFFFRNNSSGGNLVLIKGFSSKKLQFFFQGKWQSWRITRSLKDRDSVTRFYVSDGEFVCYRYWKIKDVDYSTFSLIEISDKQFDSIGSDKNGMLEDGGRWSVDGAEFVQLLSNITGVDGEIVKTKENLAWIEAYNKIAIKEFKIPL